MISNVKRVRIWKETVMFYLKIFPRHSPGERERVLTIEEAGLYWNKMSPDYKYRYRYIKVNERCTVYEYLKQRCEQGACL
jgi:hypothetical protein